MALVSTAVLDRGYFSADKLTVLRARDGGRVGIKIMSGFSAREAWGRWRCSWRAEGDGLGKPRKGGPPFAAETWRGERLFTA